MLRPLLHLGLIARATFRSKNKVSERERDIEKERKRERGGETLRKRERKREREGETLRERERE